MPCPHFTKRDNECSIFEHLPSEEEQVELVEPEQAPRRLCHSSGQDYLRCPFYQRRAVEVRRAF